ncbi:hypothetical protein ACLOJK_000381 [Asimina triloba]
MKLCRYNKMSFTEILFPLLQKAGGLGINLTAADTVIFYESDWNPTLDLQAMDRAHRLGQTKEVTVYRLICKETIEEKILQRASQKNTVQQLVMTGGHVQGNELLGPEDVVSLLFDDAQLEQKLKETAQHLGKDRQKKKRGTKGILIDAEGEASLEDFSNLGAQTPGLEPASEPDGGKANNKKKVLLYSLHSQSDGGFSPPGFKEPLRKSDPIKQPIPRPRNPPKQPNNEHAFAEVNEPELIYGDDAMKDVDLQQKPKRPKRPKKSVNENLEPAFDPPLATVPDLGGTLIAAAFLDGCNLSLETQ